jgi:hypothetical protein
MGRDLQIQLAILREMFSALYQYGEADLAKKIEDSYNKHINFYQGGAAPGRSNF